MKRRSKTTRNQNRRLSGGFVALNIAMLLAVMTALACGGGGSSPTAPPPFENTQADGTTGATVAEVPIPAGEGSHIRLEKATNGEDADLPPGPTIPVGDPVTWTYVITNLQEATLSNLALSDDIEGVVTCPTTTLLEGESMTCTLTGVATTVGQYENVASVTGDIGDTGQSETVTDPSHYFGEEDTPPPPPPPPPGDEGCTPGFWKNNADKKGAVAWPPGYMPSTTLDVVGFVNAIGVDPSAITMQEALNFGGGPDLEDWERRLFRHSTAAVLNAASEDVFYPWTVAEIVDAVNIALASDDQGQINGLKDDIDAMNNLGCPINQKGER